MVPLAGLGRAEKCFEALLLLVGVAAIAFVIVSFAGTFGGKCWVNDLYIIIYSVSFYVSISFNDCKPS